MLIHILLCSTFSIQRAKELLFDENDHQMALQVLETLYTHESHIYQYFIKKVILGDATTAIQHLVAAQDSDLFDLIYSHNSYFSTLIDDSYENNIVYFKRISKTVYDIFMNNKKACKSKRLFSELGRYINDEKEAEHLTILIRAGNMKAADDLLKLMNAGRVQPSKHEKILKKLAIQGNAGAMGILGVMYYDGWNVDKCVNTAMHYFTEGARKGDPISYNGMGNIYRDKMEYKTAKEYYIRACESSLSDAEYNLFMFYRNYYNAEEMALDKLLHAASKGYIPASYTYAEKLIKSKNYRRAIMFLAPMVEYSPILNSLHDTAEKYFVDKKYDSCLLVLLLCAEMGSSYSLQNILYLIKNVTNFNSFDRNKVLFETLVKLTNLGYKSNLVDLGDCYYYGRGVLQSYSDAFAFYLSALLESKPDGAYSLSYLYEYGLGVEMDLMQSLKYISMVSDINEKFYLLVWYVKAKLIFKIIVSYLISLKMLVTLIIASLVCMSVHIFRLNKR